ncbi:hypothetical protein E2986_07550 [Frieseomelitta varia]|uniref:Uncharacterized protein n=1 Tax=Frieseomelitta varia TaxID=561572 RepID=A0A833RA62_9HYME|nr:hypothetical protein E2986_07550 [Frieseomelitta varia]
MAAAQQQGGEANVYGEDELDKEELAETKPRVRRYHTKHMKLYPELYRSDVSIHPSYTALKILPYLLRLSSVIQLCKFHLFESNVVCRRRLQRIKKQIRRQLNRDIMHFAMMRMLAIDSVRVDRVFSVGMPPKTLIVPDLLTVNERRHINELLRHT